MSAVASVFSRPCCSESEHPAQPPLAEPPPRRHPAHQARHPVAATTERAAYLPVRIAQAVAKLLTSTQGWAIDLGCAHRSLLARIVGLADRDQPGNQIYVRRTTLADWIGASLATVQRLLLGLQEAGWIERDQVKSRARGFQVGEIRLTPLAVDRLFVDAGPGPSPSHGSTPSRAKPYADSRRSSVTDALLDTQQCLHRQPGEGSLNKKSVATTIGPEGDAPETPSDMSSDMSRDASSIPSAAEAPRQHKRVFLPRLPGSLQWLKDVGITPAGICSLMAKARDAGSRLEDVAAAAKNALSKARNPFAYLHALIAQPRDWKALAQRLSAKEVEEKEMSQAQQADADLIAWAREIDGSVLSRADRRTSYAIMGRVACITQDGAPKGSFSLTLGVLKKMRADVDSGCLTRHGQGN